MCDLTVERLKKERDEAITRNSDYLGQLTHMTQERDNWRGWFENCGEALKKAHHELTTLHGLTASDGLGEYSEALSNGLDAEAAWSCFVQETWKIDTADAVAAIDAALSGGEQGMVP